MTEPISRTEAGCAAAQQPAARTGRSIEIVPAGIDHEPAEAAQRQSYARYQQGLPARTEDERAAFRAWTEWDGFWREVDAAETEREAGQ
jgi:hypothetical protein